MCAVYLCIGYLSLLTLLQASVLMEKNDASAYEGNDGGSKSERPPGQHTDDEPNKNPCRGGEHAANWVWNWQAIFSLLLVIVGALQIRVYLRQANIMDRQEADSIAQQRPWLQVVPAVGENLIESAWNGQYRVFFPVTIAVSNHGASPARNVVFRIRPDSAPYVFNNEFRAAIDQRLKSLCAELRADAIRTPDAGIPIFQTGDHPVTMRQGSDSIDDTYFHQTGSTSYVIQGCVDYTYADNSHGQTAFRYLLGKVGDDKTVHGIAFMNGSIEEEGDGLTRSKAPTQGMYFSESDGGNFAN